MKQTKTPGQAGANAAGFNRRRFLETTAAAAAIGSAGAASAIAATLAPALGPRPVRHIENFWIPMPDGVRLAARAWLPEDAEQNPVPALLEYIPYRKRDKTRLQDEAIHPYFASHGYASIRVDIRGFGDSEGEVHDEYAEQELNDGAAVVDWLARQTWCAGSVGMFGISWGGINALQIAAKRPAALKAIISHCSTDDRFGDDAHYMDGTVIRDMFTWGSFLMTIAGLPPDPEIVGARWRSLWKQRLESLQFYPCDWLTHQRRDAFWRHGSVSENYNAIQCPVYAMGGWLDPYSNAVGRLLENLRAPRKGLIGPWTHVYPHQGYPGPAIDWLDEARRWWDYWLKDIDNGIMDEPVLRVWMQDEVPKVGAASVPGRWVAEDQWPARRMVKKRLYLTDGALSDKAGAGNATPVKTRQTVGATSPAWLAFNLKTDLHGDQRLDDARSVTFDTPPLEEDMEILGDAKLRLRVSSDRPVSFLAVRLNEVMPDGASNRVSYRVHNLTHRGGSENPAKLTPGEQYDVSILLMSCAHRFKKGNKIRIALSTTFWPIMWPSPEAASITLYEGKNSTLTLPLRPPRETDSDLRPFAAAYVPAPMSTLTVLDEPPLVSELSDGGNKTSFDKTTGVLSSVKAVTFPRRRIEETNTVMSGSARITTHINDDDPSSARMEIDRTEKLQRHGWDIEINTMLRVHLDKEYYHLEGAMKAFENGEEVSHRHWKKRIKRLFL